MSISGETVFSILIGGLISGVITWLVAERYFRRQDERAEQVFEVLVRMVQNLVPAVTSGGQVQIGVTRDEKGRIDNASLTIKLGTIGPTSKLYPPQVSPETSGTGPKQDQEQDLMS